MPQEIVGCQRIWFRPLPLSFKDLQPNEPCAILRAEGGAVLKLLRISNIAVVSAVEIEFGPGLNLLTGETGAGKSILVDALSLLLGGRASADLLRTGETQGAVEAVLETPTLLKALEARGLPADGEEVILRRDVSATGKSRAAVNGALVPVALLRELMLPCLEIHGQHDRPRPAGPRDASRALDGEAGLEALAASVAERHRARARMPRASCRRCGETAASWSGAARCWSSRRARSRPRGCGRARRRSCARRRRCSRTPAVCASCRSRRTRCSTRTTARRSRGCGRCTGSSRTSPGSIPASSPRSRRATACSRRSRSWRASCATTAKASRRRRDVSTRSRAGWRCSSASRRSTARASAT